MRPVSKDKYCFSYDYYIDEERTTTYDYYGVAVIVVFCLAFYFLGWLNSRYYRLVKNIEKFKPPITKREETEWHITKELKTAHKEYQRWLTFRNTVSKNVRFGGDKMKRGVFGKKLAQCDQHCITDHIKDYLNKRMKE